MVTLTPASQQSHSRRSTVDDVQTWNLTPWQRSVMTAAENGNAKKLISLLDNNTLNEDVDAAALDGTNALLNAVASGSLEAVQALVSAGCNVNYTDSAGFGAITVACYLGHLHIIKYIMSIPHYRRPPTGHLPLMAAATGHLHVVKYLCEEKKVDVNEKGEHGYTALMMAAEAGQCDIAQYLAARGADLSLRNHRGGTVFDIEPCVVRENDLKEADIPEADDDDDDDDDDRRRLTQSQLHTNGVRNEHYNKACTRADLKNAILRGRSELFEQRYSNNLLESCSASRVSSGGGGGGGGGDDVKFDEKDEERLLAPVPSPPQQRNSCTTRSCALFDLFFFSTKSSAAASTTTTTTPTANTRATTDVGGGGGVS